MPRQVAVLIYITVLVVVFLLRLILLLFFVTDLKHLKSGRVNLAAIEEQ